MAFREVVGDGIAATGGNQEKTFVFDSIESVITQADRSGGIMSLDH